MSRRRIRRKYQTGGSVIPSFQGAQVLSQPQRIEQRVNPIVFDPNATFQALSARQQNLRTAISQAQLNRAERMDAWRIETDNRKQLDTKLKGVQAQLQRGVDQLTKLDMNIPEQFQMAQVMRRELDRINTESSAILTDNSISPQDRMQRLQEKVVEAQGLFTNPEYVKSVQNNTLTSQVYDQIAKQAGSGKNLVDYGAANNNIDLARRFQRGEIDRGQFFDGLQNFTLDPKSVDRWETQVDKYINDSLDPDKALTNWERYKNDDDFLIFQEKFSVPDLESQVDVVFDLYKNNGNWLKVQEARGNRQFLGDDGFVDDERLRDHIRRKIQLIRGSLGAQGKDIITDVDINRRPSRAGGAGRGANTGPRTAGERRNQQIQQSLNQSGYTINDPSIIDNLNSATEAIRLLETPDEQLTNPEDREFKRDLERAIEKTPGGDDQTTAAPNVQIPQRGDTRTTGELNIAPAPINATALLENKERDENGYLINQDLQPGDNNGVAPKVLGGVNLGYFTNNPLNIKGPDTVPVIKRFDRESENDTIFHRVFPNIQTGLSAGFNLIDQYKSGRIGKFNNALSEQGKSLEDATLTDMYGVWATGSSPEKVKRIADAIGVSPDTKIQDIPTQELAVGMMAVENPQLYRSITGTQPPKVQEPKKSDSPTQKANKAALSDIQTAKTDIATLEAAKANLSSFAEGEDGADAQREIANLNNEIRKIEKGIERKTAGIKSQMRIEKAKSVAADRVIERIANGGSTSITDLFLTTGKGNITVKRSNDNPNEYMMTSGKKVLGIFTEAQLRESLSSFRVKKSLIEDADRKGLLDVSLDEIDQRLTGEVEQSQPTTQEGVPQKPAASTANKKTGLGFFDKGN